MRRKRAAFIAAGCLVWIALLGSTGHGWEFEMTGSMNWNWIGMGQLGAQGFFGPYNVDNGAGTTTANLNYWWGSSYGLPLVTGSDISISYFYVIFEPIVKINPAVRLKGKYHLGQWNNPLNSYYFTQDAPGTDNALSQGQWTLFWGTAITPWGSLGIGKRYWTFGTGLQYDGPGGLSTESIVLSAPYGPFDIGMAFYPHRPARRGQTITIDPYDLVVPQYFNFADRSGMMATDVLGFAVYNNGPLQMGILGSYSRYHIGPEAALRSPNPVPPQPPPSLVGQDSDFFHGTVFMKYNAGTFFFNAEAAWLYWTDRLSNPTAALLPNPRYTEQWRYMAETGCVVGPSKVSLLFAWSPGPDRRNSNLIDRQSAAFVWHPTYDTFLGNYDLFRPYSMVLSYMYGSGFNAYNLGANGYMRDFWVLGTRVDYAVAANLNVYATFLWAERTASGYGWGCIAPNDLGLVAPFVPTPNDGNMQFVINGAAGSPNIPDRALGWEIDTGFDWALLEGLNVGLLAGYWPPGKWFAYACIDRSVPNWNIPAPGNFWGTRPGRSIDPVMHGTVYATFAF